MVETLVDLRRETLPCWFDLSFDSGNCGIVVKVHRDFPKLLAHVDEDLPTVKSLMKAYGFSEFQGEFRGGNFGFDGALVRVGDQGPFLQFLVEVPRFQETQMIVCSHCRGSHNDCSYCGGTGKEVKLVTCKLCHGSREDGMGGRCPRCKGRGKEPSIARHTKPLDAIMASLSLFSTVMEVGQQPGNNVASPIPQLLTVKIPPDRYSPEPAISGVFSREMVRYLAGVPLNTEIMAANDAMKETCRKLFGGLPPTAASYLYAVVSKEHGWLGMSCPADTDCRCGLRPTTPAEAGRGYAFTSFNTVGPAEQLILLAGLAALCDKARNQ